MDKHYFLRLLHKYRKGELTNAEQEFVESYYNLFQNEPDILDTLSDEKKQEIKNDIRGAIWEDISKDAQPVQKLKFLNKRLIRLAAAAVLVMLFITSLFFLFDGVPKKPDDVRTSQVIHTVIHPKENRVICLPDGSTAILSSGSKLNYPSSFDGLEKREVFLEGQAFFDIKHNPSRPFIVHTGKLETVVLGTAFNIKAIPGEMDITVTVKRGKVRVSDEDMILGVITPNQQITYNKKKAISVMKTVDSDSILGWKERDLLFDNLTIAEAAELLQERYKIKIIIRDQSISSQRFTASFPKNESFEQALNSICEFNGVSYQYNKEKSGVIISNK